MASSSISDSRAGEGDRSVVFVFARRSIHLTRVLDAWVCDVDTPPADSASALELFVVAARDALVGASVARMLNDGIIGRSDAAALGARIGSLMGRSRSGEGSPPVGVTPEAWDAVACHAVAKTVVAPLESGDFASLQAAVPEPLVSDDPWRSQHGDASCVVQAAEAIRSKLRSLGALDPMRRLALMGVGARGLSDLCERTGLGRRAGDQGVLFDMHQTSQQAMLAPGLLLGGAAASGAYRLGPSSADYKLWIANGLAAPGQLDDDEIGENIRWAVADLLVEAVESPSHAAVPVEALEAIAGQHPGQFRLAISEHCSWGLETDSQILAVLDGHPTARRQAERAIEATNNSADAGLRAQAQYR